MHMHLSQWTVLRGKRLGSEGGDEDDQWHLSAGLCQAGDEPGQRATGCCCTAELSKKQLLKNFDPLFLKRITQKLYGALRNNTLYV